ncbi:MAG: ABC transporter permease subunit [Ilumatobacteraceae bacterium]
MLDRLWPVLGATALLLSLTTTVGPSLVAAAAAVAAVLGYAAGRTLPVNGIKLVGGLGAVAGAGYFAYVDPFDWLPGKFPGPRSIVQLLTMLGWVLALAAIALAVGWLVSLVVQRVARVSEASSASLAAMVIGVAATATFLAVDPLGVVPDIPYVSLINIWLGLVACVIGLVLLVTMVLAGNPTGALAALGLFGSLAMLILLTEPTGWDEWGGMMLNVFLAVVSISLCFPIGVMLALGRRSEMPLVRAISTGYIELFRGVPLYVLLVMAGVPLTLFIPRTVAPGSVARAIIVFTLFTAAYVAEIVRGGLQSLPRGQTEAGQALGMPGRRITAMIVLPQALRNVIPATVGQFISLFKDTTLAGSALSFIDLLGAYDVATSEFQGQRLFGEAISFVMLLFWVGSITMSRESQRLERRTGSGHTMTRSAATTTRRGKRQRRVATRREEEAQRTSYRQPAHASYSDATKVAGTGEVMIELRDVWKRFGKFVALREIDLAIGRQEVVVVIGPSGSGKSTMIRCINRLEQHDQGEIVVDGTPLTNDLRNINEVRRETGMVFQQFNLFPHLTVH